MTMDTFMMRMRRAAESPDAPAAADANPAPASSNETSLDVTTTTEAAKTGFNKIEAEVMEQIQKCKYFFFIFLPKVLKLETFQNFQLIATYRII